MQLLLLLHSVAVAERRRDVTFWPLLATIAPVPARPIPCQSSLTRLLYNMYSGWADYQFPGVPSVPCLSILDGWMAQLSLDWTPTNQRPNDFVIYLLKRRLYIIYLCFFIFLFFLIKKIISIIICTFKENKIVELLLYTYIIFTSIINRNGNVWWKINWICLICSTPSPAFILLLLLHLLLLLLCISSIGSCSFWFAS